MNLSARRRLAGAALAAAALIAVPTLAVATPAQAASQDIVSVSAATKDGYRQQILEEINTYRKSHGLQPVRYSPTITGIAQDESDRVVRAEYVSHSMNFISDPRKGSGVDAMNEITALEYRVDPAALVKWWQGSPSHNKVLLSSKIDVIGIGVTLADGSLANTGQPWRIVSVVDGFGYAPGHGPADARTAVTGSAPAAPVGAAPAAPAPVTPQKNPPSTARPVAAGPYADVPSTLQHAGSISWAKKQGVLTGWSDGTFRPHTPIQRNAMAAVAYRLAGSPAYTPPARSPYTDVRPGTQFYKEIAWAHDQGILTGWADGTFRPHQDIARDATAALLWRMAGEPAASSAPRFTDVGAHRLHGEAISWMASAGISQGYRDGTYRPSATTNRDAMAAFLHRFAG